MKKSILLLSLLLALVSSTFGQALVEYNSESYGIKYPKGWTVEEDGDANLVKFTSPEEQGVFQVIVAPTNGNSALELLNGWIERTGYTNENTEEETQMSTKAIESYGAEDGATGMFEPTEDGVDLFFNVDVYVRGDVAYFLIATTTVNDTHGNIEKLGGMAGSFGLMD
jgi:hypothetical protein